MLWTFGAHLVGAILSFDAEIFARMLMIQRLPRRGITGSTASNPSSRPLWSAGRRLDGRALRQAVGVTVPDGDEHDGRRTHGRRTPDVVSGGRCP